MKKHYKKLIQQDAITSSLIRTPEGRENYWNSLLKEAKNYDLIDLLKNSIDLGGDIIEFGVWRGHMTKRMSTVIRNSGATRRIFACDSFEGFGEETITEMDTSLFRPKKKLEKKFTAANDVPDILNEFFKYFGLNGFCVKGFFNESLAKIDSRARYCFAHVDCDAYKSHLDCLEYVYSRMLKGGCIVFDDYDKKKWPGATKAVDEFLLDKPENLQFSNKKENPAWYFIKV